MVTTEEQVDWNLNMQISLQIDSLLRSGRRNSVNGNVLDCFFMFKEIRLLINHHFNAGQRKIVDDYEDKVNSVTIKIKQLGSVEEDDFEFDEGIKFHDIKIKLIQLRNQRFLLVEKYRKIILRLLDAYGYLMTRKRDATQMF